jgi:hypothetical protein
MSRSDRQQTTVAVSTATATGASPIYDALVGELGDPTTSGVARD